MEKEGNLLENIPMRWKDAFSGSFNLTHSSTVSFHFLPKEKRESQTIKLLKTTQNRGRYTKFWVFLLQTVKMTINYLTSCLTNLRTSLEGCFLNLFTCLPISVSYNKHTHKSKSQTCIIKLSNNTKNRKTREL